MNVIDLAQWLSVYEMTIRRDLIDIEKEGLIHRVHERAGIGALTTTRKNTIPGFP